MDIENNQNSNDILVKNEKCRGKIYIGSIIGGIVGLTFLIKWIVEQYTEKETL